MSRVFLIPGLGADCRIYKHINIENYEVVSCNWIEPDLNDTLETYAQKIINQFNIQTGDIVIGNSMGGIVAVEIAKKIQVKKAIIISSIKTDSESPLYFRFFRRFPVFQRIPGKWFSSFDFLLKPIFGKVSNRNVMLFNDMLKNTPPAFIKWAMRAILSWHNDIVPPNVYHITGDSDFIFPYKRIKGAQIVKGGTHLMIFTKAKELNRLLGDILAE
ncbi:MAG: alpha/beta hydrolase [Sphingobacteriaceae bacterium]|nr:MAG: alpha/beta hydrolase [Sphingobacteriaceae bacterium]